MHRVQRVPATEAQGRIHTATATVAVLPEAEDVDLEMKPEDLRLELSRFRSRRPRRQHNRFGRADAAQTDGHNRALPGRPQSEQE